MESNNTSWSDAGDADPFPWFMFPNYPDEQKLPSYWSLINDEDRDIRPPNMQSGQLLPPQDSRVTRVARSRPFRGQYGTTFRPPGLEDTFTWVGQYAKHAPPGLPLPQWLRVARGLEDSDTEPEAFGPHEAGTRPVQENFFIESTFGSESSAAGTHLLMDEDLDSLTGPSPTGRSGDMTRWLNSKNRGPLKGKTNSRYAGRSLSSISPSCANVRRQEG